LSSTIAHNGSGLQKVSFLKMLLVEDVIAQAQRPFGICLGAATLTLHRFLDLATLTPDQLALPIANCQLPILPFLTISFLPITCCRRLQSL
jgi:hypothetical protein